VLTEEPTDVEISFGGTVYFSCKAEGDPEPDIVWLHNRSHQFFFFLFRNSFEYILINYIVMKSVRIVMQNIRSWKTVL